MCDNNFKMSDEELAKISEYYKKRLDDIIKSGDYRKKIDELHDAIEAAEKQKPKNCEEYIKIMINSTNRKRKRENEMYNNYKKIKSAKYGHLDDSEKEIKFKEDIALEKGYYTFDQKSVRNYEKKRNELDNGWISIMQKYGNYYPAIKKIAKICMNMDYRNKRWPNDEFAIFDFSNRTMFYLDKLNKIDVIDMLLKRAKHSDDIGWNSESYHQPESTFKDTLLFHKNAALRGDIGSYNMFARRQHYCGDMMIALEYYKLAYLCGNEFAIEFLNEKYNPNIEKKDNYWWERRIRHIQDHIEEYDELERNEIEYLDNELNKYLIKDVEHIIKEYLAKHDTLKNIMKDNIKI